MSEPTETSPESAENFESPEGSEEIEAPEAEAPTGPTFTLQQFPEKLAVIKLPAGAEIPTWAESASLFSITATATETSLICAGRDVPAKVPAYKGLTAFAVQGPLDPELIGVLSSLLAPLAEAEIPVFALSTFDTDWILVPAPKAEQATEAWRRRGHTVAVAVPVVPPKKTQSKSSRAEKSEARKKGPSSEASTGKKKPKK
ncbi:ACT domain-containing protein [Nocardioides pacificus]